MEYRPHDYQSYSTGKIEELPAMALFAEMGLGKTVITLTAIEDMRYNTFQICRCLVIAPLKVAEDTWTREASKWDHLHRLRVVSVLGTAAKRKAALETPGDVYVINRENVPWLVDYYQSKWPFDMVVIDELTSFKNHQAKRFRSLRAVRSRIKRIVGLTGTPAPNGLLDLWAQVYLLDEGRRLGRTITEYRNNYFKPGKRNAQVIFSWDPLPGSDEVIRAKLSDICISLRSQDYLTLPELIVNTRYVQLDKAARKAYDTLERQHVLELEEGLVDAGQAAVLAGKLLQLSNGAVYTSDTAEPAGEAWQEIHDNKIAAYMELIEAQQGEHVLTFYSFRHDRDRLLAALSKTSLRVGELKGAEDIQAWNNGQLDVLLAHPASAAYGLNLQDGGHVVVWFGLTWSLELYQQANARLHRQGQGQPVYVHRLAVADTVDEDVLAALEDKDNTQQALMGALALRVQRVKEEKQ